MVLYIRSHRQQAWLRRRNNLALARLPPRICTTRVFQWLDRTRKKDITSCRRTKPPLTQLRTFRQDTDPYPDLQLGKRTKTGTEPAVFATPVIRKNHAASAGRHEYIDSQWRCIYPFGKTFAGHSQCGRRMLRLMGKSFSGHSSRSFCLRPGKPWSTRLHVTEALSGRIGRFIQDTPFPNGHRHLDFKWPCRRGLNEALAQGRNEWHQLLWLIFRLWAGFGRTSQDGRWRSQPTIRSHITVTRRRILPFRYKSWTDFFYASHTGQGTWPKKDHAPESKTESGNLYPELQYTSLPLCR